MSIKFKSIIYLYTFKFYNLKFYFYIASIQIYLNIYRGICIYTYKNM